MPKLSMPNEVRDTRPRAARARPTETPQPQEQPPASTDITVPAPKEGETVSLSIKKAEGGHIVEQHTTDKNWRTKSERTRVVLGDPKITVETQE